MTVQATSAAAERGVNKARMRAIVLHAFELDFAMSANVTDLFSWTLLTGTAMDGLTDQEVEAQTGLPGNSVRPRRIELVRMGILEDSLVRRKNANGNSCIVWRLVKR
jgi:hypothetical protein